MTWGPQLIAWRAHRNLNQGLLAEKAGVTRAYLARLESGRANPSLSILFRLAAALNVSIGTLLDQNPPTPEPSPDELDKLARAIYHPGRQSNRHLPYVQSLAGVFQGRRAALGLYRPRKPRTIHRTSRRGQHTVRRLKAILGEKTWDALLRRIDKHAPFQVGSDEN